METSKIVYMYNQSKIKFNLDYSIKVTRYQNYQGMLAKFTIFKGVSHDSLSNIMSLINDNPKSIIFDNIRVDDVIDLVLVEDLEYPGTLNLEVRTKYNVKK